MDQIEVIRHMDLRPTNLLLRQRILWAIIAAILLSTAGPVRAADRKAQPWTNPRLSPDRRAELVVQQMTLDEKIQLVHGEAWKNTIPADLGGDGFVPGIPRLGIPDLQLVGAGVGVTNGGHRKNGQATALPSALAETATWDPNMAREFGTVIGTETRDQGFNVSLGGGIDLTREPRDGRNFEYHGEDPLLAGIMTGAELKAIQAQKVIADIKHYAVNDQESGRFTVSSDIDKRSMRETDLLAFEIAIERSNVGTVMCSYNRVNDVYACENKYLLTDVLKRDWGFKGWVMSDWGATHSTVASALAGLDQEFQSHYFSASLKSAVLGGEVPMSRLDDMVHRILRTMFAVGVVDDPPTITPVNFKAGAAVAQRVEEQGCVLLKNRDRILPLDAAKIQSIAVIGSHANLGVLSGGGSARVDPQGGNAFPQKKKPHSQVIPPVWDPSPPLLAIRNKAFHANVFYDDGKDPAAAVALAKKADVVILFVNQFTRESADLPTLTLPDNQDDLVRQVAAANPRTIVVAETGGAFLMPWLDQVAAVLEAWYPGIRGGPAIANILFGDVNPSGRLPITFPKSDADLPHPMLIGPKRNDGHLPFFDVHYTEGLKVGYKWYDAEKIQPLFPFGFGLSYTTFSYSHLHVESGLLGRRISVTFHVKNTGARAGAEVSEVYLGLPSAADEPPKRLVGWKKLDLQPGEDLAVTVIIQPRMMAIFDVQKDSWEILPGKYRIYVGGSSRDIPLQIAFSIDRREVVQ